MQNIDKPKVVKVENNWDELQLEHQLNEYKIICHSDERRFTNYYYKKRFDELQKVIYKAIERGEIVYED